MKRCVWLLAGVTLFGTQNVASMRAPEAVQPPTERPGITEVSWHAPRSPAQPPAVTLVLDEVSRERGRKSTVIRF